MTHSYKQGLEQLVQLMCSGPFSKTFQKFQTTTETAAGRKFELLQVFLADNNVELQCAKDLGC